MNKYELAVYETKSVLAEHFTMTMRDGVAEAIVERLIAKGVIQSTDPDDLVDMR